jgi:hypothetical protein
VRAGSRSAMDVFTTPEIEFVGEQNGIAEQRLTDALAALLAGHRSVRRAYLVRARYDGNAEGVVLGLLTDAEQDDEPLVRHIGEVFASIFKADAWLDTVFLSLEYDIAAAKVCRPFYERSGRRSAAVARLWRGLADKLRDKTR